MIRLLLIVLALLPSIALADPSSSRQPTTTRWPVSLRFADISVVNLARIGFRDMMGLDVVVSPGAHADTSRVSIDLKALPFDSLRSVLDQQLTAAGFRARQEAGIVYIEKVEPVQGAAVGAGAVLPSHLGRNVAALSGLPDMPGLPSWNSQELRPDVVEIYRPKWRSADYLQATLRAARLSFSPDSHGGDVVVLAGTTKDVQRGRKLLEQIDVKRSTVLVRAMVVEFTQSKDSGQSLSVLLSVLNAKLSIALSPGQVLSNYVRLKNSTIDAVVSALDGDTRFRFVTEPTLRIADGDKGRLVVGSDVPVRGSAVVGKDGVPVQSIDYKTSGVVLTVEPRVFADRLDVKLHQQVSNFGVTKTSNIDSPTLFKRELETRVELDDGELLVLAGLDEDKTTDSRSALSFLPRWMASTSESATRTQMVVFLELRKI